MQYNLVLVKGRWCSEARNATSGLASHWPCVTDFVVYASCGLQAEMGTRAYDPMDCGTFTFTCSGIYVPGVLQRSGEPDERRPHQCAATAVLATNSSPV